ncbi:MAG: hydrogenase maturation protease [Candidatus Latescibacteria bacterium]|nr:hydrogenase maturation protease [Candidatus Latescibacterota bacterium]NIM66359.1 hydrogenase maturation protease [Candidatus Latescibacterota bacterium]NIO02838.1 hydrogenase maturation protease [Candidatus Latescibacterota bacterium]NIO29973.1 hydrogenase maturation protease [Candidatus Latescibacterota bacterium]NIO57588.1 hydrogenase maturation protease [Candidatus Latescibacterota bacterium]
MKVLILGLGNTHLSDDGVGVHIARRLKTLLGNSDISIEDSDLSGAGLLQIIGGYDCVFLIDAIETMDGVPGHIYRFNLSDEAVLQDPPPAAHVDFGEFSNGSTAHLLMPKDVILYAVETKDRVTFSKGCTPEVRESITRVTELVLDELQRELFTGRRLQ